MQHLYLDKKVDILTKTDKQPFDWFKNNHSKYSKKLVFIIISCLAVISQISVPSIASGAPSESIKPSLASDDNYLLDRVITWADGSQEHVQIGKDGFFRLDGVKKRLVGMFLSTFYLPYGQTFQFYLPENLSILDKELSYLESIGVRVVRVQLVYIRQYQSDITAERSAWKALLDLAYKHKILVIAHFVAKGFESFGDLTTSNFSISIPIGGKWVQNADTVGDWAQRFAATVSEYQNVVALGVENELDYKMTVANLSSLKKDEQYTAETTADYMAFLTGILRQVGVPITHNLMVNQAEPEIKRVCMSFTDFPSFDVYGQTSEEIAANLKDFLPWMGVSSGWWCLELNYVGIEKDNGKTERVINTSKFSSEYIDTVFSQGAAVAILFWSNDAKDERRGFFDKDGMPKPQLVEVAGNINRFQTAINESSVALEKH